MPYWDISKYSKALQHTPKCYGTYAEIQLAFSAYHIIVYIPELRRL